MPYKVAGLHGLSAEGLSLKEARELVRQHLEKPEFADYSISSDQMLHAGKLVLEIFVMANRDSDIALDADIHEYPKPIQVAQIEYVKGKDDAL